MHRSCLMFNHNFKQQQAKTFKDNTERMHIYITGLKHGSYQFQKVTVYCTLNIKNDHINITINIICRIHRFTTTEGYSLLAE